MAAHTHTHTTVWYIKYVESVTELEVTATRAPYLTKSTLHIMFSLKEATSKPGIKNLSVIYEANDTLCLLSK
jgi:hypothetical protein